MDDPNFLIYTSIIVFLSKSPAGTPSSQRTYSPLRSVLSLTAVVALFGTLAVAPFGMTAASASEVYDLQPGEMPSQKLIAKGAVDSDFYTHTLEISQLPEPEPDPEPEPEVSSQNSQEPAPSVAAPPAYTGGGSPEEWMTAAGIAPGDWGYVNFIASRESGWNPNATNASSGACGLIQAHPCSKVPGSGYNPVDNLRWANGYAVGRYGSWAAAYDFWVSNHWW